MNCSESFSPGGDHILDYENCDMSLDHIECHETDTLYCFFKREEKR